MGNYRLSSDIDLALEAPEMSFNEWLGFQLQLDGLLFPYKIDTILLHFVDQDSLKEPIKRVGVVFFESGRPLYKHNLRDQVLTFSGGEGNRHICC